MSGRSPVDNTPSPMTRRSFFMVPALAAVPHMLAAQTGSTVSPSGTAADGVTLDTPAIQVAIDRSAAAGGGIVNLHAGRYLIGTLHLRDNVMLHLEAGAVLLGSKRLDDYPVVHDSIVSYTRNYTERCLIRADNVTNTGISGAGTIDGNEAAFPGKEYMPRPFLMRFIGCHRVHISGITLQRPAMWTQHYLECEDVVLDGVRVRSRNGNPNGDGVDIDSCRRVRISNCDIDASDDAIVLKATTNSPCRDVVVSNCILSSAANAFKLGTESEGGFDSIVFSNSVINDTNHSGIALETVDGGNLRRVSISNITIRNTRQPIFLRLGNRARPISESAQRPGIAEFSGVMIRGAIIEASSPQPCILAGLPGHPIQDVVLEDIQLTAPGGGTAFPPTRQVPEVPEKYPEANMFGDLPASAIYCRHVSGLSLNRVTLRTAKADARPALVADDVEELRISNFNAPTNDSPLMEMQNVRKARIRETETRGGQPLLKVSGSETQDIVIASEQERLPLIQSASDVRPKAWRVK